MDGGAYTKSRKDDGRDGATHILVGPGLPGMTQVVASRNVMGALLQAKLALDVALMGARQTKLERSVALLEALLENVNSAIQDFEKGQQDG